MRKSLEDLAARTRLVERAAATLIDVPVLDAAQLSLAAPPLPMFTSVESQRPLRDSVQLWNGPHDNGVRFAEANSNAESH